MDWQTDAHIDMDFLAMMQIYGMADSDGDIDMEWLTDTDIDMNFLTDAAIYMNFLTLMQILIWNF